MSAGWKALSALDIDPFFIRNRWVVDDNTRNRVTVEFAIQSGVQRIAGIHRFWIFHGDNLPGTVRAITVGTSIQRIGHVQELKIFRVAALIRTTERRCIGDCCGTNSVPQLLQELARPLGS